VRALLALARGCGRRSCASRHLWALRGQPLRRRRAARVRVTPRAHRHCGSGGVALASLAVAVGRRHRARPAHQERDAGCVPARRGGGVHVVLQPRARVQHRRGVQFPGRRRRLAALAVHRSRRRRLRRDGVAAEARRQTSCTVRGWRSSSAVHSAICTTAWRSATSSISCCSIIATGTILRSMSRTARSLWARWR